mmetsp:Transcript_17771/g.33204  ORF Transcript_17771/g.33204 Transcript_17771/m.33204 type:complete len:203 (+) Transcript_17771:240-848(+)
MISTAVCVNHQLKVVNQNRLSFHNLNYTFQFSQEVLFRFHTHTLKDVQKSTVQDPIIVASDYDRAFRRGTTRLDDQRFRLPEMLFVIAPQIPHEGTRRVHLVGRIRVKVTKVVLGLELGSVGIRLHGLGQSRDLVEIAVPDEISFGRIAHTDEETFFSSAQSPLAVIDVLPPIPFIARSCAAQFDGLWIQSVSDNFFLGHKF